MRKRFLTVLFLLLFSASCFADMEVLVATGDSLDELGDNLRDGNFEVRVIEDTPAKQNVSFDDFFFSTRKFLFDNNLLILLGTPESSASFNSDLLFRFGASTEHVNNLDSLFNEGKEVFGVNASIEFVEDSNISLAWVDVEENDGNIFVSIESGGSLLDLDKLKDMILFHELSHIAFDREIGNIRRVGIPYPSMEFASAKAFEEYSNDVFAQKTLPKEKREAYAYWVKLDGRKLSKESIELLLDFGHYEMAITLYARALEYEDEGVLNVFDEILNEQPEEFRKKFFDVAHSFHEKAQEVNEANFEESVYQIIQAFWELRQIH